ncbi:hypothetical protein MAP00_007649 [Monascus purpureus]|nr:hypothetical protein MAP00_007649 [Monascus purpureus]
MKYPCADICKRLSAQMTVSRSSISLEKRLQWRIWDSRVFSIPSHSLNSTVTRPWVSLGTSEHIDADHASVDGESPACPGCFRGSNGTSEALKHHGEKHFKSESGNSVWRLLGEHSLPAPPELTLFFVYCMF